MRFEWNGKDQFLFFQEVDNGALVIHNFVRQGTVVIPPNVIAEIREGKLAAIPQAAAQPAELPEDVQPKPKPREKSAGA